MIEIEQRNNGADVIAAIEAAAYEAVERCTVYLWQKCVEAVGVSNPRPHDQPSLAGEPPRLRTGWGQRNVAYELDPVRRIGRVGVRQNALYMVLLDQGTRWIQARPWLWATAERNWDRLQALARGE